MGKLDGKIALVTGASKGLGAEIAIQLAAAGANVVVNYASSKAGADKIVGEIEKLGRKAVAVQANLAVEGDVRKLFKESKAAFGHVDILINNAGVYEFMPLEGVTSEHFHRQFDINVLGLLFASQEFARQVTPNGGSVVNVSSVVATSAMPNAAVYAGTKGAVDTITKVLAKELAPQKIRVNSVNPGLVATEGASDFAHGDFGKNYAAQAPLGRVGVPQDIAPTVVFLAGNDSAWITGENWTIAGGYGM